MNLILISVLIAFVFAYIIKVRKRRNIARKLHGPKYIPLIGYVPLFFISLEDIIPILSKIQSQFKRFFKVWVGPEFWFIIYDPKLSEKILTDQNLTKSKDYELFKPWLGLGLLTNEGKSWFVKRKAITPAFHFMILESFIEIFEKHSEIIMKKFLTNEIIDVFPHMLLCSFRIICETSMGSDMTTDQESITKYIEAVKNVARISYKRIFNIFLSDWIFWFLKDHKILYDSLDLIDKFTQNVINDRRELLKLKSKKENIDGADKVKQKQALLDTLLTATIDGNPLTDREIKDEVNTFLFAGHDTTGSTMSFLLYNIAKYKDVQEKIFDEIKRELFVNGSSIEHLNISKLNNLNYLDLVIKESMRLYTPVPIIGRQTTNEYQLDDVLLPDNTNISIYIYGMFHDENLFPEPEKFIPERFATNYNTKELNPFSYTPFSAGHRNCIGQKFALLEIKTIVVKILEKFEIEVGYPNKDLILEANLVLRTKDGIHLKFKLRK